MSLGITNNNNQYKNQEQKPHKHHHNQEITHNANLQVKDQTPTKNSICEIKEPDIGTKTTYSSNLFTGYECGINAGGPRKEGKV